jgi:hypothetical protein
MAFSGILRRNANGVKIPSVVIALGPPVDRLVSSGETSPAVQPMSELPNDPVAKTEALGLKYGIEDGIKRDDFPVFDVVSDLPANRPLWVKNPNALFDYTLLCLKIAVE